MTTAVFKKPIKLGITGSIGMGKTTIASEISKHGFLVWNSDKIVHSLYKKGNDGYNIIKQLIPEAIKNNTVDRKLLSSFILDNSETLEKIQKLLYPILELNRMEFIKKNIDKQLLVFDIPLLFETSCDKWLDIVIVATAPVEVQRKRVLGRVSMNEEKLNYIMSKQMSNTEKITKADFVLSTDTSLMTLSLQVKKIIETLIVDHA